MRVTRSAAKKLLQSTPAVPPSPAAAPISKVPSTSSAPPSPAAVPTSEVSPSPPLALASSSAAVPTVEVPSTSAVASVSAVPSTSATALLISGGHEVEIADFPSHDGVGDSLDSDDRNVEQKFQKRLKYSRPFYHENVAGWKYYGTQLRVDLNNSWELLKVRNFLWHDIKRMCGGKVKFDLEHELVQNDDPNDQSTLANFHIRHIQNKGKKRIYDQFAMIEVIAQPGKETYFRFLITNPDLAKKMDIDVRVLRRACEYVFSTVVLRCVDETGNHDENLQLEIKNEELE